MKPDERPDRPTKLPPKLQEAWERGEIVWTDGKPPPHRPAVRVENPSLSDQVLQDREASDLPERFVEGVKSGRYRWTGKRLQPREPAGPLLSGACIAETVIKNRR